MGILPIVQYLIEQQNIDINGEDEFKTAHLPIVEYLISKCAKIEANDEDEQMPLHFAQDDEIVNDLVSKGVNKNVKDKGGRMLYIFAENDEIEMHIILPRKIWHKIYRIIYFIYT